MSPIKFAAALAVAVPAIALAQVGPNPAVNGSLDPTVGPSTDRATAPNDAPPSDAPPADTTMQSSTTTPATASDPATTADDAKRTTAPTSETKRKKPR